VPGFQVCVTAWLPENNVKQMLYLRVEGFKFIIEEKEPVSQISS
jgi:hypothetical protein